MTYQGMMAGRTLTGTGIAAARTIRRAGTGITLAGIAAFFLSLLTPAAAYDRCARQVDGQYDWLVERSYGRLSLSAADIPDFITHAAAPGVNTGGEFAIELLTEGGIRQMRITPPIVGFNGIPLTAGERARLRLIVEAGRNSYDAEGPAEPHYALTGYHLDLIDTRRKPDLDNGIRVRLVLGDRVLVEGDMKTFLLEAGMDEWDHQTELMQGDGCLR